MLPLLALFAPDRGADIRDRVLSIDERRGRPLATPKR